MRNEVHRRAHDSEAVHRQCLRRELVCEWPTESKRGQHKRHPRVKPEDGEGNPASVGVEAGPSAPRPPKSKSKSKAKHAHDDTAEHQTAAQRHAALKRQRKLAAAQRKRLEARMMSAAKA